MTNLDNYLMMLAVALEAAKNANLGGDKVKALASLEKIVRGGMDAYAELAGEPLDLDNLQPIELL